MLAAMDGLMSIGEFSERSGLSPKRLRSYASAGLLPPAAVDPESGYRYYAPGQLHEASMIDELRRADVPLSEISALLSDPSPRWLDRWARQLDQDNDERRAALARARALLGIDGAVEPATNRTARRGEQTVHLMATTCSDIGPVRAANQDRALGLEHLVAVADGMGESPQGETASALTMAIVEAAFSGRSLDELHAAARAANTAVFERARSQDLLEGMGTTLCAAGLTAAGDLAVVNVGDSRAYLCRDGSLRQLTIDHTLVAELVRQGELAEDEIASHPQRSVLTRAVGVAPTVEADAATHGVRLGDRLLLCSDGLSNEVPDDVILALMTSNRDLDETAQALVERALANGGQDNIAVVLAEVST
jgi:PPM family protein phosphatase